jgi:hypothetical protein
VIIVGSVRPIDTVPSAPRTSRVATSGVAYAETSPSLWSYLLRVVSVSIGVAKGRQISVNPEFFRS